ncbi:hypothetical protein F966_01968 [Acinetobacter higginsii]|uniref:Uncharacterized protein n=1 Tax=Acinetobacter higginsii TaxID=70347 RepID=N8WB08_9GAMM|nr:hypothetical protein [Acinetobacter higginsii]ENV09312.1 hypothetical protein F966_01968 [Acinetobacter higginsii]
MKKSIQAIEHTPIYNWHDYKQRQKQRKIAQIRKNFIDGFAALSTVVFTVSLFFFGGR